MGSRTWWRLDGLTVSPGLYIGGASLCQKSLELCLHEFARCVANSLGSCDIIASVIMETGPEQGHADADSMMGDMSVLHEGEKCHVRVSQKPGKFVEQSS